MLKMQIYLFLSGDMKTIFGILNKTHFVQIKNQNHSWENETKLSLCKAGEWLQYWQKSKITTSCFFTDDDFDDYDDGMITS